MQLLTSKRLLAGLRLTVSVLILKVTVGIVVNYRDYLPPNFQSDFLLGRESYFSGSYQWAFYTHIFSGPCSLILGLILLSDRFRRRHLKWHRYFGRIQTACVLLIVAPSGIWMAMYAATGAVAGAGFASLAAATGLCAWCGWRSALNRDLVEHRRWMSRCYLLLCSAVVLRLTAGLFTISEINGEWTYPLAAWTSWLVPLGIFELTAAGHFGGRIRPQQQEQLE